MSEYPGRRWVCTCGWKGPQEDAGDHASECLEEWPSIGPRYRPDPHRAGEQADLTEYGVA